MSSVNLIYLSQNDKPMDGDKLHFTRDDSNSPKATLQLKNIS